MGGTSRVLGQFFVCSSSVICGRLLTSAIVRVNTGEQMDWTASSSVCMSVCYLWQVVDEVKQAVFRMCSVLSANDTVDVCAGCETQQSSSVSLKPSSADSLGSSNCHIVCIFVHRKSGSKK